MTHGDFPPDDWSLPDRPGTTFVDAERPLDGNKVATVVLDAIGDDVECAVFEIAGVAVPEAVGGELAARADAGRGLQPDAVLVTTTGQRAESPRVYVGGELGSYPWNFDLLLRAVRLPVVRRRPGDDFPLQQGHPFSDRCRRQGRRQRDPVQRTGGEQFGAFTDAASMEAAILLDLQALMFRRAGVVGGPKTLGRTALGALSSGNNFMAAFLQSPKNRAHSFCQNTLREVYCFDPPFGITAGLTAAALAWAGAPDTGRRIALYTQAAHDAHTKLLGQAPPASPFVETSPDGTRTSAVLPSATWKTTVEEFTARPWPQWGFQETHQIISATMLTHAIATSGF